MVYTYICPYCGGKIDILRSVKDREEPVFCGCSGLMKFQRYNIFTTTGLDHNVGAYGKLSGNTSE